MPVKTKLHGPFPAARAHVDELLDEALNETFPASDPVAINIERRSDQRAGVSGRESRDPFADAYGED